MNAQEVKKNQTQKNGQRNATPARSPQRRRPNPAALRLLRNCMLGLAGLIFVVGMLLIILPLFRVKTIVVEGNSYYSAEQIIEASGIEVGQEILGVDVDAVCQAIWAECLYVNEIGVGKSFSKITIVISERENVMYTEFNGDYYSLDSNFRVLERSEDAADFSDFLRVELPQIQSLSIGKPLHFEKEEMDLSYIGELIGVLEEQEILDRVTSIDFSKKYSVSYVMDNTCRVELGRVDDLSLKLEIISGILEMKGDLGGMSAVVDVTNLSKPTFRLLGASDTLLSD
ncbi:MAG: FtsQ-type POTRA domain-containing protein [Ruminococcaceae bacterium]|nr:FtsQ-type POTRA domain-containing protein [Oscillospiraceae bacterium]